MPTARRWSSGVLVATWLLLVFSAAFISVPILGLISWLLVPASAVGLAFAVVQVRGSSPAGVQRRRLGGLLSAVATLLLAGLAVHGAMVGSMWLLAWQRGGQAAGAAGVWLLLAGLNVLAVIVLALGNELRLGGERRTNFRLTLVVGSTPVATLSCLFVVSRLLPLSA